MKVASKILILFAFVPASLCGQAVDKRGERVRFQPPERPAPLPDFFPSFVLADIEVDSFIEVNEAREAFDVSGKKLAVAVIDSGINSYHHDFAGKIIPVRWPMLDGRAIP